tara:strand:- start:178 stop:603 length:426 start_codon:yes stop_codon:yes gene_type:complete
LPGKLVGSQGNISVTDIYIAKPPRPNSDGNIDARCFTEGRYSLQNRTASAGNQVKCVGTWLLPMERSKVASGQVHNMNVVSYATTARDIVVITMDLQSIPDPDGNLTQKGDQVPRDTEWMFSYKSALMRSCGIEIPQTDGA